MKKDEFLTIKTAKLNNHCPECYSTEGLQLTFSQRFIENVLYKSLTNEVATILTCSMCETTIYPVNWTDDIERVVAYNTKAFVPKSNSFKLKKIAWILFIALDLIVLFVLLIVFKLIEF